MAVANQINDMVNVEKIMQQIRRDIEARWLTDDALSFSNIPINPADNAEEYDPAALNELLGVLGGRWNVAPSRPIVSRSGPLGKIIIFFKKVVRKCIRFYIEPIVADQNESNQLVFESLSHMAAYMQKQSSWNERLDDLDYEMNREVKKANNLVSNHMRALHDQNRTLKQRLEEVYIHQTKTEEKLAAMERQIELYVHGQGDSEPAGDARL